MALNSDRNHPLGRKVGAYIGAIAALGSAGTAFAVMNMTSREKGESLGVPAVTYKGPQVPPVTQYREWFKWRRDDDVPFGWAEYNGGKPHFLNNVPADTRPWEQWFRSTLEDGGQALDDARLFRAQEIMALYVYHDERLKFSPGRKGIHLVGAFDEALEDAFRHAGIASPSNEMIQLGMAEMAAQYPKRWGRYDLSYNPTGSGARYHPPGGRKNWTMDEILSRPNLEMECEDSAQLSRDIIRTWEQFRAQSGRATGIQAFCIAAGRFLPDTKPGGHAYLGVEIGVRGGREMKLHFDNVALRDSGRLTWEWRYGDYRMGTLSKAGMELFAAFYCPADPKAVRPGTERAFSPSGDPAGRFLLGNDSPEWLSSSDGKRQWDRDRERLMPDLKRLIKKWHEMGRF